MATHDQACAVRPTSPLSADIDIIPCTQRVPGPLDGVVALVEVRGACENRFCGVAREVEKLGGKAVSRFTSSVTHLIFQNGKPHVREKAVKKGIPVVSVLWLESCRQTGEMASEAKYPILDNESTPVVLGKLKRMKSMQPKSFDEELSRSLDRARRKREKQLEKAACKSSFRPVPRVLCEDTQSQSSPFAASLVSRSKQHSVPETQTFGSGCEDQIDTASLAVQNSFYGFMYRDIEKDEDLLKARELGSQSLDPSQKLNFDDSGGSGVVCAVGESPSTHCPQTSDPTIQQTPTSSRTQGTSQKRKRKLLNRDSLPTFHVEPEVESETIENKVSRKSKKRQNGNESKLPPSKKARDTPRVPAASGLAQRPRTRSGGGQSGDSISESEKDGTGVTLKEKDRNSLSLFVSPKKWRQPPARSSIKSNSRKLKRKMQEGGGGASLDDKWKVPRMSQHSGKRGTGIKPQRSLVMTSVPSKDRELVMSVLQKLGGFFLEKSVTVSTTHVVFSQPRRTLNTLTAIARGCWLVSIDWVYKSVETGHWVDETLFEVDGLFPAAKACRERRFTCGPQYNSQLFSSCPPIFISHDSNPSCEHLSELVALCGGKVTRSRRRDNALCVGQKASSGGVWLSEQWIMDCVTQDCLMPTEDYAVDQRCQVNDWCQ